MSATAAPSSAAASSASGGGGSGGGGSAHGDGTHDVSAVIDGLGSAVHLARDRALLCVPELARADLAVLRDALLQRIATTGSWEPLSSALQASSAVLSAAATAPGDARDFSRALLPLVVPCAAHSEARVRTASGSLLGDIAAALGSSVWDETSAPLLSNVARNFDLDEEQRLREADDLAKRDMDAVGSPLKHRGLQMVHETEGWRGLETSLLALGDVIRGCGKELVMRFDAEGAFDEHFEKVLSYVKLAKTHTNRFIREAGLRVLECVVDACIAAKSARSLNVVANQFVDVIASGLQDNWSQVRYVASVVTRKLMKGLAPDERRSFYPKLLPRMCLNRHYVAEGVRSYSQETWKSVVGSDGRLYLVRLLEDVVGFYESQCGADNHSVREAACQSLAECSTRLDPVAVSPFVPRIFSALIDAFKDESWPVRDHASCALAAVVEKYAVEVERTGRLAELRDLFKAHLSDNIASVRQNTASSFVKASRALPSQHPALGLEQVAVCCRSLLPCIAAQEERSFGDSAVHPGTRRDRDTGYGAAAKLAHDNDVELHTGQIMYSCGSLAPKLRRGGGCLDHGFSREKEPWEETDGAVWLWLRLAESGPESRVVAGSILPMVVDALQVAVDREFAHAAQSQESILSSIAGSAGLVPRDIWSADLVSRTVSLAERVTSIGSTRATSAAKSAMSAIRRAVGYDRYSEIVKSAK